MKRVLVLVAFVVLAGCTSTSGGGVSPPDETATSLVAPDTSVPGEAVPGMAERRIGGPTTTCGVERWAVKTGIDPDAAKINTTPVDSTIASLSADKAQRSPTTRVAPVETTEYRVTANLVLYKIEADSDYHLVLDDGKGHTMIAEIPAPSCVGNGPLKVQMALVRQTFDAKFRSASAGAHRVKVPVTVVGVGFFDKVHGQAGVASNGIELHPVTNIIFN